MAGSTKLSDRPTAGTSGMQALPPAPSVSRDDGPEQAARSFPALRYSGRRLPAAPTGGGTGPELGFKVRATVARLVGEGQFQRFQVIAPSRSRNAAVFIEQPPGKFPLVRLQHPAFVRCKVDKRKHCGRRTDHGIPRTYGLQIPHGMVVAGQKQMVAIIDAGFQHSVEIRSASTSRPADPPRKPTGSVLLRPATRRWQGPKDRPR